MPDLIKRKILHATEFGRTTPGSVDMDLQKGDVFDMNITVRVKVCAARITLQRCDVC